MSWPVTKHLGVQLGYGLEGSLIYRSNSNGENLIFAKDRKPGIKLHSVPKNTKILIPAQHSEQELIPLLDGPPIATDIEVPEDLIKDLEKESDILLQDMVYDPTVKKLMSLGRTRMKNVKRKSSNKSMRAILVAGGELGNLLIVSLIALSDNFDVELLSTVSLALPSTIKQVVISDPYDLSGSSSKSPAPYILVRSETTVYIVKFWTTIKYEIKLTLFQEFEFEATIADICFNPWDPTQFATIDSHGVYAIWTMATASTPESAATRPHLKASALMVNPIELSSFKMLAWGNDTYLLFIFDRSNVQLFNSVTKETKTILVLSSFSSIKDYVLINHEHSILLTSKEIILLQVHKKGFNRLISWKHSLDANDPSLKAHVTNLTNLNDSSALYHCSIFSSFDKLSVSLEFGIEDGLFKMLGDPYMSGFNGTSLTKDVFILPFIKSDLFDFKDLSLIEDANVLSIDDEVDFLRFRLTTDLELSVDYFNSRKFDSLSSALPEVTAINGESIVLPPLSEINLTLDKLFEKLTTFPNEPLRDIGGSQSEEVQGLAYHLSSRLDMYIDGSNFESENLSPPLELISGLRDIDEVDSMIEQLTEHFSEKGLNFSTNFTFPTSQNSFENPVRMTYQWLRKSGFEKQDLLNESAIMIALSLITFTLEGRSAPSIEASADVFPKDIKQIILEWGHEEDVEEQVPDTFSIPSSFMMPSINVSQPNPNPNQLSNFATQLPVRATPDSQSSQGGSQSGLAASQVERGVHGGRAGVKKKKKKRLGGFA